MTADEKLVGLIDRRRELAAQVAGLDAEIALAVGDRDGARRAAEEMKAQTLARCGAKFAAWEAGH